MPRNLLLAALALCAAHAQALTPQEIFTAAEPSVVVLEALDANGEAVDVYSALALDPERIATQCDLLGSGQAWRVSYQGRNAAATPERRDEQRNLCTLTVTGLKLMPVRLAPQSKPPAGSAVYALGNTLGMGVSISEGLVSGVREYAGETYIQFTAPIGPGAQGGGLFDAQARLLGLMSYSPRAGQNVNFALPAQWLREIEARGERASKNATRGAQAYALRRERKWQELAQLAQAWSAEEVSATDAWFYLGEAQLAQSKWRDAERAFREVLKREPNALQAALGAAKALTWLNEAQAALDLLKPWLARQPELSDLWSGIGFAQQSLGQTDAARSAYEKALDFGPWNRDAHYGLAELARKRKDWPALIRELRSIAHADLQDATAWLHLSEAYLFADRPAPGLAAVEHALSLQPQSAEALLRKGILLIRLNRTREGIEAVKQALAGKLEHPRWGWKTLGDAYYDLKLWPEALGAYRAGLKAAPTDLSLRQSYAVALKDSGQFKEALALFEQLKNEQPDDAFAWRQIGYVHSYLDQSAKAVPAYERALAIDPKQAKVWRALMEAYHSAGRRDDMRRAYEKLAALDRAWAEQAYRDLVLPYEESRR